MTNAPQVLECAGQSVKINGRTFCLPEGCLLDALRILDLSTEGYVALEDYAEAVGLTLGVLEKQGRLVLSA